MTRFAFSKPARAHLLDELVAAGLPATTLVEMDGGPDYATNPGTACWVTCDEAQYDTVAAVVAAHNAAAIDAAIAQAQTDDASDRTNRATLFQQCKQDYQVLTDTTTYPMLTQAQYRAMLAHVLRLLWLVIQVIERRGL